LSTQKITWPVQRKMILKEMARTPPKTSGPGITEDLNIPYQESTVDLEIADDPLTKYFTNENEDNMEHVVEETERDYLTLLNKAVDRILYNEKINKIKFEKLGKVLAKHKEARKNKVKDPSKVNPPPYKPANNPPGLTLGVGNYFNHILERLPSTNANYAVAQAHIQALSLNPSMSIKQKTKLANALVNILVDAPEKDSREVLEAME
jgi:hypothetical protein